MSTPEKAVAAIDQQQSVSIDYVPSVAVTLEQAKENFQRLHQVTKELMQKGVDYDTIPGTPKPTLLKPGAEHLLQFFGLGHRVQRVEAREDWDNGFFYYCYRVSVFKARPMPDGSVYEQIIAECEGSANSKEKRYRNQDVFTLVNTLQKMAIKRALVGATLQATGTSGMFTQDIEDLDEVPPSTPESTRTKRGNTSRKRNGNSVNKHGVKMSDVKAFMAKLAELGYSREGQIRYIQEATGKTKSDDLTLDDMKMLEEMLEKEYSIIDGPMDFEEEKQRGENA